MVYEEGKVTRNSQEHARFQECDAGRALRRVAVVKWRADDGISSVICDELRALKYTPVPFQIGDKLPDGIRFVFSFGPYGEFLRVPRQLAQLPADQRPLFIHWNTEGLPDLRIPPLVVRALARLYGSLDSWIDSYGADRRVRRIKRFRYVGDYYYAHRCGWIDVFADSSAVYARWHHTQGLRALYAPWGSTPRWHKDLNLERNIDVLWMGNRESRRRDILLTRLHRELVQRGVNVYLADNVSNPFIFNDERTAILNRSKITLNLLRTWYDDNYSRFALAASNRSLLVSEPLLPHCPDCSADIHYVSSPVEKLADTIIRYLRDDDERERIVANAYDLVIGKLRFHNSIAKIMSAAESLLHPACVA